jgi:methionyl-tRNA synthetase
MDIAISEQVFWLMTLAALWTLPFKGFALWKSAKRGEKWWFIAFMVVNTLAILEIVYLFFIVPRAEKKERGIQ